ALSLEPALVMWAPGRFSRRFEMFEQAQHFAIHIMADDQLQLARHFARDGFDFSLPGIETGLGDTPLLPGCLARFECARHAVYPGGDHAIVVGKVLRVGARTGAGLSFFGGAYGSIG
ncbi:MAG: flavin reductase family protein, partial [Rhodobacteraceae bacterium]|nr:flavin reductase family protein [Paracoccaceae bacterium]